MAAKSNHPLRRASGNNGMSGKMRFLFILLVVGALAALAAPEIGTIAAITIIGLPLAIVYWALPAVALVAVLAWLISFLVPFRGPVAAVLALVASLAVLAIIPLIYNRPPEERAAELVSGDHDDLPLPLSMRSVALRQSVPPRLKRDTAEGYTQCNQFCIHMLLNGTAERVLIAFTDNPHAAISSAEPATEYRLQEMAECPAVKFRQPPNDLYFRNAGTSVTAQPEPVEELMLRVSSGSCLVEREAMLGEAEVVLTDADVTGRARNVYSAKFDLGADTLTAHRRTVHRFDPKTREPVEIYRRTSVKYLPLGKVLLPYPYPGAELRTNMGWWRTTRQINREQEYPRGLAWTNFLTQTLGLDMALAKTDRSGAIAETVKAIQSDGRAPNPAEWQLIANHFDRTGRSRANPVGPDTLSSFMAMLEDPAFPVPPGAHRIISSQVRSGDGSGLPRIADAMVSRLKTERAYPDFPDADWEKQIHNISIAIWSLPDETLQPHADTIIQVAAKPDVQINGLQLLRKLSVFGERAVPTLIGLIDTGLAGGENFFRDNHYQHPYLGGLGGLCLAGQSAASALPELRERIDGGLMPVHASYGKLLTVTLIRLGADEDTAFKVYLAGKRHGEPEHIRKLFDALAKRARSDKPDCDY